MHVDALLPGRRRGLHREQAVIDNPARAIDRRGRLAGS